MKPVHFENVCKKFDRLVSNALCTGKRYEVQKVISEFMTTINTSDMSASQRHTAELKIQAARLAIGNMTHPTRLARSIKVGLRK